MRSDRTKQNSMNRVPEAEDAALPGRIEDTILFGLVADAIYQTGSSSLLISQLLERISVLKNIPLCACLEKKAKGFIVADFYALFGEPEKSEIKVHFSEIISHRLNEKGYLILDQSEFKSIGFSVNIPVGNFVPSSALIIPCSAKSSSDRFFVFLDDNATENRFPELQVLLQQVLKLVSERIDNIFMLGELTRLNRELDQRVKERTDQLTRANQKLTREILERKVIEKALGAEEKKLRLVYNAAKDVSFVTVDLSGQLKIRSFSPGAEKMFGYSADEVIGKPLRQFLVTGKFNILSAIRSNFKKHEWSHFDETVLYRKSGEPFPAMLTIYPLIDEYSRMSGVLAVCIDISELKQAQNELIAARKKAEESEIKFRTLFEQASDGIFISDGEGNYIEVNESACQMLGYSKDELLKLNLRDIIEKDNLSETPVKIKELNTGNMVMSERILVRKDGTSFPSEISGKMFPDGRMQGIVRDITDRKKFESELIRAKEKAEESHRLKTAFLQNMSHEIRTPLNAILGFADLLPEFFDDRQKLVRFADIIKQRGNDLLSIINDILDIARIESGQVELNLEVCRIERIFDEMESVFDEYQHRCSPDKLKFSLHVDPNIKSLDVIIDQAKLKQILFNLIGNAFKFTSSGRIEVSCSITDPHEFTFCVSDTGIGIPKEKHAEIFNRFIQGGHDTARLYGGTGLGLSIVMGLLDLMGGHIWLESEKGQGSTFYFTLPFSTEDQKFRNSSRETVRPYNPNVKILIVDDDELDAMYLKDMLWDTEFTLLHAVSGKEAIETCAGQKINLVVTDIRLPDMDGYQLMGLIKKQNPRIGIIALAANATYEGETKALNAGFDDYLSKLETHDLLLSKINLFLAHQHKIEHI